MKFSELSNNSTVLDAKYEKGVVSFSYHDRVRNTSYLVSIKCPRYRSCFFSMEPVGFEKCGEAAIDKLSDHLSIDTNGKFTLGKSDVALKAVRYGSIIAVGLKADEYPYLASVRSVGSNIVYVSVPIRDENDITLEVKK